MITALLIIDVQELITTPALYEFEAFKRNLKKLLEAARESGTEVIYVRHDDGVGKALTRHKPGYEIYSEIAPTLGELIFDKTVNSPFKESGLLKHLKKNGIERLIVAGLQTDYCIDATVKCGFEHGFDIVVPEYANTTVDNEYMTAEQTYRYYNRFIWKKRYATCVDVDEAIYMMKRGE